MNLPCLCIFAKFYIFEGRFYGLEAHADKSALVVIRPAPAMAARLRHPDGWFFQVKDATKTLGLTYGNGFDTAKILVNDRIGYYRPNVWVDGPVQTSLEISSHFNEKVPLF